MISAKFVPLKYYTLSSQLRRRVVSTPVGGGRMSPALTLAGRDGRSTDPFPTGIKKCSLHEILLEKREKYIQQFTKHEFREHFIWLHQAWLTNATLY